MQIITQVLIPFVILLVAEISVLFAIERRFLSVFADLIRCLCARECASNLSHPIIGEFMTQHASSEHK